MRSPAFFLSVILLTYLLPGCSEPSDTETTGTVIPQATEPQHQNCRPDRVRLEGNVFHLPSAKRLVAISRTGTEETAAHRTLEIYDTRDCSLLDSLLLPVQPAPDFPYLLADINYNRNSHLVGIKGYDRIFCYHLDSARLLDPLVPQYRGERFRIDAQSAQIRHLEVWEHYLVGYAQDFGVFVFDLAQAEAPEVVLPTAEYQVADGVYNQLFVLPSAPDSAAQILLPRMSAEEGLSVNPQLNRPRALRAIVESATDNPYIILRDEADQPIAIDMTVGQRVQLPPEVQDAPNEAILRFLRTE